MIELKPHVQRGIRSMEMEAAQLNQQLAELNAAFRDTLAEQIPAGANLDDYELKCGKNGEALGLVLKPQPVTAKAETTLAAEVTPEPAPAG